MSQRHLSPSQFQFLLATSKVASDAGMKVARAAYQSHAPSKALLAGETGGHQRVMGELREAAFGYDGAKGAELS